MRQFCRNGRIAGQAAATIGRDRAIRTPPDGTCVRRHRVSGPPAIAYHSFVGPAADENHPPPDCSRTPGVQIVRSLLGTLVLFSVTASPLLAQQTVDRYSIPAKST
jgi:hypothetical protein